MNFFGLLFLIITQFLAGRGTLALFKIRQKPLILFVLSSLVGIVLFSLLPMLIQFFYIPINHSTILISICVTTLLLNIIPFRKYDYSIFKPANIKVKVPQLYELIFIVLFVAIMIPAAWRCYYYPPFSRDVQSGPEAIAEYAVREGKINNSVFTMNLLESTPNLLKPPFVTDLQIIYKLFVHPFGQLWLIVLASCFLIWIYHLLREKLHPFVAGILMLFFITIPEVYGYTYIVLWDYANMVYYFAGVYFLFRYIETKEYNLFLFSCLMFGFATFVRLETLMFIALVSPALIFSMWKDKIKLPKIVLNVFLLAVIPFIFYFIWVNVFVQYYLPVNLESDQQLNLGSKTSYWQWWTGMNEGIIFGGIHLALFSYFIYFFLLVLLLDTIFFRKFNREARFMLFGVAVIYFGLPLLTYFTQWFNINTGKRGLFKMFPLMIMYMRSSEIFARLSQAVAKFEFPQEKPAKSKKLQAQPIPQASTGKKKKK